MHANFHDRDYYTEQRDPAKQAFQDEREEDVSGETYQIH